MKQAVIPFPVPYPWHDGRGPSLNRWLHDSDLLIPDIYPDGAPSDGRIVGAEYYLPYNIGETASIGWVVFHKVQVIQFSDVDIHSFWHVSAKEAKTKHIGIWEIKNSTWKSSFTRQDMEATSHCIVEFYDDVVDVICEELVLGVESFDIERVLPENRKLAHAYIRKAMALEKRGDIEEAISYYEKYIQVGTDQGSIGYARRVIRHLLRKKNT